MFLPVEVYGWIEEGARATEFGSVDEDVMFVLGEALKEEGEGDKEKAEGFGLSGLRILALRGVI